MEPSEIQPVELTPPRRRRFTLQWSLSTMLLLMVVVAAWVPYVRFRQEIPQIEQRIDAMRDMTRELIVEDPTQITAVHLPQMWYDEHRWDIYLPAGEYRMHLTTCEVDQDGFPPAMEQALLSAGKHRIELLQSEVEDRWKIVVTVDDRSVLEIVEQPGWPPSQSSSGASRISTCRQYAPD
ncbi:MAG TPA: hypothetical protein VE890_11830, partial [Thermoguttaceae bacterium]|nr:hypothetical protein [Thermoguttaceae bacterium]